MEIERSNPSRTKSCRICGCEFPITSQTHYIATDNETVGLASAFGSKKEVDIYDAFDCPNCGCQMIIQRRKRAWESYTYVEDNRQPEDASNIDDGK